MALAAAPDVPGFRALSPLGYGPASTIYSAQSLALERWVALTVYSTTLHEDRARRRFRRGFEVARRLGTHPHTVTVLDSGLTAGRQPFVVSELYELGTVESRVTGQGRAPLAVDRALHLGITLAGALETAHRADVIHGGVHPGRVMQSQDGEVALADVGLVALVERGGLAALVGPMDYHAAPEVLEDQALSPATDVYSLASTVYTALAGRAPYEPTTDTGGDTAASLLLRILQHTLSGIGRPDVPSSLEQLLRQALRCEPRDRPARPLAFARALQSCQQELGLRATQPVVLDVAVSLSLATGERPPSPPPVAGGPDPLRPVVEATPPPPGSGPWPLRPVSPAEVERAVEGSPAPQVFVPYPAPPASDPLVHAGAARGAVDLAVRSSDPVHDAPSDWPVPTGQPTMTVDQLLRDAEPRPAPGLELRATPMGAAGDEAGRVESTPEPARTRALPVIVLGLLVAVIFAGVTWSIVAGDQPTEERATPGPSSDRTNDSAGLQPGQAGGLTAVETAAGVQLDWDSLSGRNQVVVVLSTTEPPRSMPADSGSALLIGTDALSTESGYCFAVLAAPDPVPNATALAEEVSDEALGPDACIGGATAETVRRR